jgi:hypothetical protein
MTNSPPLSPGETDDPVSSAAPTYEVGYCRPPVHSRVKPGQVLNPRGRPKGQRNVATVLQKALNERTKIREGSRTRSVTKLDAIILKMINDAGLGNPKALANLLALMRAVGLVETGEEPTRQQAPLTDDDEALIADFAERNRLGLASNADIAAPATEADETSGTSS